MQKGEGANPAKPMIIYDYIYTFVKKKKVGVPTPMYNVIEFRCTSQVSFTFSVVNFIL